MEHENSRVSFLSAFADYVFQQRNAIGRRWIPFVKQSLKGPGAKRLSDERLSDHMPELLEDLANRLRAEQDGPDDATVAHARSCEQKRWQEGYRVSELVWEIYFVQRIVTQLVLPEFVRNHSEYSGEECAKAEVLVLDFFQRLTCNFVGELTGEREGAMKEKYQAFRRALEIPEPPAAGLVAPFDRTQAPGVEAPIVAEEVSTPEIREKIAHSGQPTFQIF